MSTTDAAGIAVRAASRALVVPAHVDGGMEAAGGRTRRRRPRSRGSQGSGLVVELSAARRAGTSHALTNASQRHPRRGRAPLPVTKHVRVVIADDDHLFATGLKALLAHDDRVEVVGYGANGEQAVSLARVLQPALVLVDLHMPVLDGLEAARQILSLGDNHVVLVTSSDDLGDVARAREIGVDTVLHKSVGLDELAATVSRLAAAIAGHRD
jgi:CheY-like chemotaxis protein